jgi:hypothetical protein
MIYRANKKRLFQKGSFFTANNFFLYFSFAFLPIKNPFIGDCQSVLRPGGPRHRNAAAPGTISLRSIAPAKAAFAATGIFFLLIWIDPQSIIKAKNKEYLP